MKTFITGGAGFIGSHLTELLLSKGDEVTLLDNLSTGKRDNVEKLLEHPNCTLVEGTIQDEALINRLVAVSDRVFHLAAAVGVQLIVERPVHTIETNIHGSEVVLSAAANSGTKLFLASTSEVYGKSTDIPFKEDGDMLYGCTKFSRWSYAASKAIDEFLALAYHREMGFQVVITRFFNTVGPRQTGQYGMVVPRFIRSALLGEPIRVFGDGKQTRCFGDVKDVIRGVVALMEEPKAVGEVYNLGAEVPISIEGLAKRVIELTGSKSQIEYIPYEKAYAPGFDDLRVRQPSLEKAKAMVGYEPTVSLDQCLQRIIDWTKEDLGQSDDTQCKLAG